MPERDPLDVHISVRLRAARRARRLSLQEAGSLVNVSYQQMQKYENGLNRVSAATLFRLCVNYGIEIGSIFRDYAGAEMPAKSFGSAFDAIERIVDGEVRQKMRELAETLAAVRDRV